MGFFRFFQRPGQLRILKNKSKNFKGVVNFAFFIKGGQLEFLPCSDDDSESLHRDHRKVNGDRLGKHWGNIGKILGCRLRLTLR